MNLKRILSLVLIVIVATICLQSQNYKQTFFTQRLHSPDIDIKTKISYIDSLLAFKPKDKDSLNMLKTEFAYKIGDYRSFIEAREHMDSLWVEKLPLNRKLNLELHYMHSLERMKRYMDCLAKALTIMKADKPDSLMYYDAHVNEVMFGFIHRVVVPNRHDYLNATKSILDKAIKENIGKYAIDRIRFAYYAMSLAEEIQNKRYDRALNYADSIMSLPQSDVEKLSTEGNIAFIYMMIGENEIAEKHLKTILESPLEHYNKGVALLNYTHLLNEQGRFQESLDALNKYKESGDNLNRDMYYSYLLGNKAIAESHVIGYEKGFATLMESKQLGDSINYNSGIQDGFMLLENSDLTLKNNELREDNGNLHSLLIAMISLSCAVTAGLIALWLLNRRRKRENDELVSASAEMKRSLIEVEEQLNSAQRNGDKLQAAELLTLAEKEEALRSVAETLRSKTRTSTDKLNRLNEIINSLKNEGNSRELFERQFEQAHSQFFKKLYAAHPDMTQGESRLCAYIIMNLTTKEIAAITNKSARSIDSMKYRINKKFNLPDGQSVLVYLRQFV